MLLGTLLVAVFGMYWDISLHIDNGRDPGPLANPAHYFILIGLFGVLFAGVAAIALPLRRPDAVAVRLPNGWWAPLGGLLIAVCGAISLIAFPLDDIWHRLFGQDVTLWGPTHLLLIGGASFSLIGAWILHVEGERGRRLTARLRTRARAREVFLAGSFLVGLSTFQAEFDFAVPQFRLVCQPILLMLAAGIGLVVARVRLGRGGALAAVVVFIAVRGLLAFECARAREFYARAAARLSPDERPRLVAAEIMRGVYFEMLRRIERNGYDVFTTRIRVPKPRQALIALKEWLWTA